MYEHQYRRERAAYEQDCTESMIRMRQPSRRFSCPHPNPLNDINDADMPQAVENSENHTKEQANGE